MSQERPVSEKDLLKVARYLRGFDVIKIERHDQAGGFKFISRHQFFSKSAKYIEQAYPEIYRDRITINDGLDPLFYAFEIKPGIHRFVISTSVLKRLMEGENDNIRIAAEGVIKTIRGIKVDKDSSTALDEFLNLIK